MFASFVTYNETSGKYVTLNETSPDEYSNHKNNSVMSASFLLRYKDERD